jgi:hypothetical protein
VLALTALPATSFSQVDQGSITGAVTDTSGAAVPKADVALTSTDTGLTLHARTDANGIYTFSPIKIGNYSVTVKAQGFQTTTQENLHLDLQQRLSVNVALKPGSVSETVTVTTAPP